MKRRAFPVLAALAAGVTLLMPAALASVRPDDRAGPRGADVTAVATQSPAAAVRPDDRAGIRGVGATEATTLSPAASHPDNRAGPRGVLPVAVSAGGTNWTAIGIGIGVGAAVLLVLGAAAYTLRGGGWHMPHRPAHTH